MAKQLISKLQRGCQNEGYSSLLPLKLSLGNTHKKTLTMDMSAAAAKLLQLCLTLCNPIDGSPSGSTVPGILQARTLEWVPISFSKHESEKLSEVTQSCPTLRDPMDCSPPGSSVHGILQARVLEWGAIAFSDDKPRQC